MDPSLVLQRLQRLSLAPNRARFVRNLGAFAVCAAGTVLFGLAVDRAYPIRDWLVWRLSLIWLYAVFFNVACVSAGAAVLRLVLGTKTAPAPERLLFSMTLGLVLFVLGMYALGFAGAFRPRAALILPLVLLGAGHRALPELVHDLMEHFRSPVEGPLGGRVLSWLAIGYGAIALCFLYLEALDTQAINFDANWYHFATAQDYARLHRIVPFPGENHRAYPHLTSFVHTWALLVPGLSPQPLHWMLSLHLEYGIVVWRIVGVYCLAAWLLEGRRVRGLWAVFFLFPSLFVYDQSIGGSADHFLGFFAAPMMLACARFVKRFDYRWGIVLGAAAAGHTLTKYQAIYLLSGVFLTCVVALAWRTFQRVRAMRSRKLPRARASLRRMPLGAAVALGVAILMSAPHFVKNAAFYGNPVYPFAQSVFKSSSPKRQPGFYQEKPGRPDFQPRREGLGRQVWAARMLFEYPVITGNRNLTKHRPYMGALFACLLPCLPFVRRARRLWLLLAVAVPSFLVWANTGPNDRYLLAFLDLFIAGAAALVVKVWDLGLVARCGLVPVVGLQLVWGGDAMWIYGGERLRDGLSLLQAGWDGKDDDTRFADRGTALEITAATPKDAVIFARNYKSLLGLDRTVLSDIRAAQDYISYSKLRDPRALHDELAKRKVTHLLYPEGKRPPKRLNNLVLFHALFERATDVQRFGSVVLGVLPEKPPPKQTPFLVLVKRVKEYPDGLYRVEQLDIDSGEGYRFRPSPKPVTSLRRDNEEELLGRAHAVVFGGGGSFGAAGRLSEFERAERVPGYELYLRRDLAR